MKNLTEKKLSIDKSKWQAIKLGDVVAEPKELVKNIKDEGIEHVVGLEHIDSECVYLRRSASIKESTIFTKKFSVNDVLFGRRRAYLKKAAQSKFSGICSGDITVMRAKEGLLPELLPFIVQNEKFFDYAVKHSAGGLSPRVKFKDLANYEFLLPPKEQQAKLAELLWAMDEVIEKELVVLRKSIKLLKGFVEDVIHGKYLNDNGFQKTKIGLIPFGWKLVKMEKIVLVKDGTHLTPKYTNKGIPFLRVTDIQSSNIDFEKIKFISKEEHSQLIKRCNPQKGDILYSKNGTIGVSKIVDWDWEFSIFVSLALLRIKSKKNLNIDYLKLLLDSIHIKKEIYRRSKQGTITNLHLEEIRLFRVPLPPLCKQKEIADSVANINNSIYSIKNKLEISKSLQKSLINEVF